MLGIFGEFHIFSVPVGWGTDQLSGFGEERGTKHQVINLIHSVRTVMRSKLKGLSWYNMVNIVKYSPPSSCLTADQLGFLKRNVVLAKLCKVIVDYSPYE